MNYRHIYCKIISYAKSQNRNRSGGNYYEAHHILPRSLFPNWIKRKSNVVLLTAREHFFVHQLLLKIYPSSEMYAAIRFMSGIDRYKKFLSSREYERYRKLGPHNKGKKMDEDFRRKCRERQQKRKESGYTVSAETRQKLSLISKGNHNTKGRVWYTNGVEDKMLFECPEGWWKGRSKKKGKPAWNKGKKMSEEYCRKNSEARKLYLSKLSPEERSEIYGKGSRGKPAWNKGRWMSEEFKQKCKIREEKKRNSANH